MEPTGEQRDGATLGKTGPGQHRVGHAAWRTTGTFIRWIARNRTAKFWISALALSLAMTCASAVGLGITFASTETPTVRAAVPVPSDQQQVIDTAARSCPTLTPARLAGQLMAESGFDPGASNSSGGHGVAGMTDAAWSRWRPQSTAARDDVKASIVALAHDMCDLIGQVRAANVPGDGWHDALAAYRSGVAAVVKAGGVPSEATGYVELVAAYAGFYTLPPAPAAATPSQSQSQARQSAAATSRSATARPTGSRSSPSTAPSADNGGASNIIGPAGKCVDVVGVDIGGDGAAVDLWDCDEGARDQNWAWSGSSLTTMGMCLDIAGGGTTNGTRLQLHDCTGNPAQVWIANGNGTLSNPQSGKCVDAAGGATDNGTRLQIWDCNGTGAQTFVKA